MSSIIQPSRTTDVSAYIQERLGEPWKRDGLHCWRFVLETQRDLFGRVVPPIIEVAPTGLHGRKLKPKLFAEHPERDNWREVLFPENGSIVLMSMKSDKRNGVVHAGTYLIIDGGGVLHCDDPQGVAFDNLLELTLLRRWRPTFLIPKVT